MIVPVTRALLSVSDKTGIVELARFLGKRGIELVSTGGTAAALRAAGLRSRDVSEVTGFPEIMDGRVKTLHPRIHGGILARRDDPGHRSAMADHAIAGIDLVAVTLYPFAESIAKGEGDAAAIENIDVGGPALIRAAAKNHEHVVVLTDPADYEAAMKAIADTGGTSLDFRRRLAAAAFRRTAAYDAAIAAWFGIGLGEELPAMLTLSARRRMGLRYGENPHQRAAFYAADGQRLRPGVATAVQSQGKELGYNNLADADAAFELAAEFERPAAVIVKHANPCGAALADTLAEAYGRALESDPVSAYGGIVAVNRALDAATAAAIAKTFYEVIVAPKVHPEAKAILGAKPNLRVLETGGMPDAAAGGLVLRSVSGGYLLQTRDAGSAAATMKTVSKRQPSPSELADLRFAATVAKHVKSNAIVLAKDGATVGIGAGQMSRVDAARIAVWKAAERGDNRAKGAVVASDAFFPFADGLIVAAEAGCTAAIHPGGSVRDAEVIAAADAAGMALVVTGTRHFRH